MCVSEDLFLLFFRHIEGQDYDGVVKPKEQAQQQYSEAVSRGQSAGIVRYKASSCWRVLRVMFFRMRDK